MIDIARTRFFDFAFVGEYAPEYRREYRDEGSDRKQNPGDIVRVVFADVDLDEAVVQGVQPVDKGVREE